MKWIMQMHHNIFILAEVEVWAPVPGIYEYANKAEKISKKNKMNPKRTELAAMALSFNGN